MTTYLVLVIFTSYALSAVFRCGKLTHHPFAFENMPQNQRDCFCCRVADPGPSLKSAFSFNGSLFAVYSSRTVPCANVARMLVLEWFSVEIYLGPGHLVAPNCCTKNISHFTDTDYAQHALERSPCAGFAVRFGSSLFCLLTFRALRIYFFIVLFSG